MSKKFAGTISIVVLLAMLSACAPIFGTNKEGNDARQAVNITGGRYDSPVTVTAVRYLPTIVQFPEGDDVENNVWTRAFEEKLNIKIKYLWTVPSAGEAYDQKINIAIASNDLPDIMPVYTSLYEKLAKADKLYDLTDVLEQYSSEDLKSNLSNADSRAIKAAVRNDKLTCIGILPATVPSAVLWVREDWMNKLGFKAPETMDDVLKMARAFANEDPDGNGQKDTWGFALSKELTGIAPFLNAYRAYDKIWLEKDGELQFSSTLPEIKKPLSILNQLFEEKVIDHEFAYKAEADQVKADIINGKIGMVFGNVSSPLAALDSAHQNDGSEWKCFPIPSADDKPIKLQLGSRVANFMAVNKNSAHPEAMIMMMNLGIEIKQKNPDWITNNDFHTTKEGHMAFFYPPISFPSNTDNSTSILMNNLENALETGDVKDLNQEALGYYKKVKGYMDKTEEGDWGTYRVFGPGGSQYISIGYKENDNIIFDEDYLAETAVWSQNGANLHAKTAEFYTMSIMEGNIDKAFDDYVNYFTNQGGGEAAEEINKQYSGLERLNKYDN